MKKMLVVLVSVLALATQVSAAEPSENDVKKLREIQQNIVVLERITVELPFARIGVDAGPGGNGGHLQVEITDQYRQATQLAGEEITTKAQLSQYLLQHDKTGGFFTFLNIVWFLASLVVIVSLSWLCFSYFGANAIEILGYAIAVFGLVSGVIFPSIGVWFVVPACLLLFGLLTLTERLHFKNFDRNNFYEEGTHQLKPGKGWLSFSLYQVQFAILTVAYGACALVYNSEVLGFMTVIALEGLLGFTVIVGPLCIGLGFNSDKVMPRATAASFLILLVYLLTRISGG